MAFLTSVLFAVALATSGADSAPRHEGDFVIHDFRFHTGERLPELKQHYVTLGDPKNPAMLVLHGSAWLTLKAEPGVVRDRARTFGTVAGIASLVLFAAGYAFAALFYFVFCYAMSRYSAAVERRLALGRRQ